MKQVLLIDSAPITKEFLTEKLESEQVHVETAIGSRDAFTKLITVIPDIVILELGEEGITPPLQDFMEKKVRDPNAHSIPIILTGPVTDRSKIAPLTQYGVVKYFNKPVRFDVFFEAIGKLLNADFSIDMTPCLLDLHLNDNLIFVEVAQGLNREKIALLKYKIAEILNNNTLKTPRLILMLTNLDLTFMDGANLELLLDNCLADSRITRRHIKILSLSPFVRQLLEGHKKYTGVEVATSLTDILQSVVDAQRSGEVSDFLSEKILSTGAGSNQGELQMRFAKDKGEVTTEENGTVLNVAIVDDDIIVRKLLQKSFSQISAESFLFDSGNEFLKAVITHQNFDLVILDIYIPDMDGFGILRTLQRQNFTSPVIIYSQAMQKETVIQALGLGAKAFLVKPQKPQAIVKKALEILNEQA